MCIFFYVYGSKEAVFWQKGGNGRDGCDCTFALEIGPFNFGCCYVGNVGRCMGSDMTDAWKKDNMHIHAWKEQEVFMDLIVYILPQWLQLQSTARVHTSNGQYMVNAQKVRHSTDAIMVKDGPICAQHVETCWLIARFFFRSQGELLDMAERFVKDGALLEKSS